jgi:hypothetical protein
MRYSAESSYSDSSRVGNGEDSGEPSPPNTSDTGETGGVMGSGVPVLPVRLAP